jgi:hypothetical protein
LCIWLIAAVSVPRSFYLGFVPIRPKVAVTSAPFLEISQDLEEPPPTYSKRLTGEILTG